MGPFFVDLFCLDALVFFQFLFSMKFVSYIRKKKKKKKLNKLLSTKISPKQVGLYKDNYLRKSNLVEQIFYFSQTNISRKVTNIDGAAISAAHCLVSRVQ